jgi:hypothetical protein
LWTFIKKLLLNDLSNKITECYFLKKLLTWLGNTNTEGFLLKTTADMTSAIQLLSDIFVKNYWHDSAIQLLKAFY